MRFNTLSIVVSTCLFLGSIQAAIAAAACSQQSGPCNGGFGACCAGLFCISAFPGIGSGTCQGCQAANLPCNDNFHGPCCTGLRTLRESVTLGLELLNQWSCSDAPKKKKKKKKKKDYSIAMYFLRLVMLFRPWE
ncbi:hypothetical protein B0H13DRAFT_1893088 [Mycena leptocephala]|nr:hypothetical protein B0H13DRAFT_1893088 [Mycena leptocephala]